MGKRTGNARRMGKRLAACALSVCMIASLNATPMLAWAASADDDIILETTSSDADTTLSVTDGADITDAVQDELDEAKESASSSDPYTITLPKGSYTFSDTLHIWSCTKLDLGGSTLTYTGDDSKNLIMTGNNDYNESSECHGYEGFENITICNGIIKANKSNSATYIKLVHGTNITMENITLDGGGQGSTKSAHMVEAAAINTFTVKDCTFQNHGKAVNSSSSEKQEALQLDIPVADSTLQYVYEDGTVLANVSITGCTFKNVARGVGTHSMLLGAYHTNIDISNNTFSNITEEAIVALTYYNCTIKNNTIANCGGGILVENFKAADGISSAVYTSTFDGEKTYSGTVKTNLKTTISGNTITSVYSKSSASVDAIRVYGNKITSAKRGVDKKVVQAGSYLISGVTISSNTIKTAGHGIHLYGAKSCTVSGNSVTGKGFSSSDSSKAHRSGIMVEYYSTSNAVTNNTIGKMKKAGIFVQNNSSVKKLSGNTISNCTNYGIYIYNKSKSTGSITGNKITSSGNDGICVSTSSSVKAIENNTITSAGKNGIDVYKKSTVSGNIASNKISKPAKDGVIISTSSKVKKSIKNNTITSAKSRGVEIYKSSTVGSQIYGNKITSCKKNGIYLASAKNKMTIAKNKIKKCSANAIQINTSTTKYKITIKSNTLVGKGSKIGISVTSGKAVTKGNSISKFSTKISASSKAKLTKK